MPFSSLALLEDTLGCSSLYGHGDDELSVDDLTDSFGSLLCLGDESISLPVGGTFNFHTQDALLEWLAYDDCVLSGVGFSDDLEGEVVSVLGDFEISGFGNLIGGNAEFLREFGTTLGAVQGPLSAEIYRHVVRWLSVRETSKS